MFLTIKAYRISWANSQSGGVTVRLRLEDDSEADLRVATLAEAAALDAILRGAKSASFNHDHQIIATDWRSFADAPVAGQRNPSEAGT